MNPIEWLFDAQLVIGDQVILWREIVGNLFGLASALGGLRRKVWAWPVGIVGNALLFTCSSARCSTRRTPSTCSARRRGS
jgi:nicotinamide mononucleotide transporter